jgi:hypothetical protein
MYVSIGGPMALIVIGAILYWATDFDLADVDMNTVGLILLIAGAVSLVLSLGMGLLGRGRREGGEQPPPRY